MRYDSPLVPSARGSLADAAAATAGAALTLTLAGSAGAALPGAAQIQEIAAYVVSVAGK